MVFELNEIGFDERLAALRREHRSWRRIRSCRAIRWSATILAALAPVALVAVMSFLGRIDGSDGTVFGFIAASVSAGAAVSGIVFLVIHRVQWRRMSGLLPAAQRILRERRKEIERLLKRCDIHDQMVAIYRRLERKLPSEDRQIHAQEIAALRTDQRELLRQVEEIVVIVRASARAEREQDRETEPKRIRMKRIRRREEELNELWELHQARFALVPFPEAEDSVMPVGFHSLRAWKNGLLKSRSELEKKKPKKKPAVRKRGPAAT